MFDNQAGQCTYVMTLGAARRRKSFTKLLSAHYVLPADHITQTLYFRIIWGKKAVHSSSNSTPLCHKT